MPTLPVIRMGHRERALLWALSSQRDHRQSEGELAPILALGGSSQCLLQVLPLKDAYPIERVSPISFRG
jgi:hypothetical protein